MYSYVNDKLQGWLENESTPDFHHEIITMI